MPNKKQEKAFDEVLRKRLQNMNNAPAPSSEDLFDEQLKNRFKDFSSTPPERVWEEIEPELPLHLFAKICLHKLSRVAAIFVLGTVCTYSYQTLSLFHSETIVVKKKTEKTIVPETIILEKQDFVFNIEEDKETTVLAATPAKKKKKKKTKKEAEMDDFLAFLLEDDDLDIDEKIVEEALSPTERLDIKSLTASTNEHFIPSEDQIDLRIDPEISLQVVAPGEVDQLLKLYDQQDKK